MNVNSLLRNNFDRIYGFLEGDEQTRKALGLCSRWFMQDHIQNQKYISIAKFIEKNYHIHAVNLIDMPLWRKLKCVNAILVGEEHHKPEHRKKNAALAHMVWDVWGRTVWSFLVEGPCKPILGKGMLAYLNDEIAQTHEMWEDINENIGNTVGQMQYSQILMTSKFLNLRDEKDPVQAVEKLEELEKIFAAYKHPHVPDEEQLERQKKHRGVLDYLRQVLPFVKTHEVCRIQFKFHMLVASLAIGNKMNEIVFQCKQAQSAFIDQHCLSRDDQLANSVALKVISGKKAFVWAGKFHITRREDSPLKILQEKKIPFISLHPKSDEDMPSQPQNPQNPISQQPSRREQLKAFNPEPNSIIESEVLHPLEALNPDQVFLEERNACLKELHELADYMKKHSDLYYA